MGDDTDSADDDAGGRLQIRYDTIKIPCGNSPFIHVREILWSLRL